jgi:hypothetical protein
VEAATVADTSTALMVEFIREYINFRHVLTTRIISDQGTAFSTHLIMEDNVKEWETHHVFATAEHPQTSGLVDRVNRTMNQALEGYVNTDMMIGIAICRQQFLKSTQLDKVRSKFQHFSSCMADFPSQH